MLKPGNGMHYTLTRLLPDRTQIRWPGAPAFEFAGAPSLRVLQGWEFGDFFGLARMAFSPLAELSQQESKEACAKVRRKENLREKASTNH
jgi:hypothetical protein